MYLVKEVVDTVKRDLSLDDHRDVIESHPHLVSQYIENCGNGSVRWSKFESNHGLPDMAEKTLAAVISSFMTTVCTSQGQTLPPAAKPRRDSHNK
jgi:hypothetical protein